MLRAVRVGLARLRPVESDSRWGTILGVVRAAHLHRTTGHAAEMAFFAVLTLVPSTVAVGSALGLSKHIIGAGAVSDAESAVNGAVRALMGPQLADSVISPFVHVQLTQPRGGVAIGGLLIAWWLSSHLFEATGHALDSAYGVTDRRPTIISRLFALGFALVSVLLVAVTVEVMVVGPLGDASSGPAADLGVGDVYAHGWAILRWPLLLAIVVSFLVCLYRFSPNVRHCWRDCLPGAVFGAVLWLVAAVGFRVSAAMGLQGSRGVSGGDQTVDVIGQSVNAVIATVLWAYLASIAILLGGEFNALLRHRRAAAAGGGAVPGGTVASGRFDREPEGAPAAPPVPAPPAIPEAALELARERQARLGSGQPRG
ncbi:MAG: rane protein [Solirubrobacteraceae bacterium]|jgi:membrane protein|nr:rane protein [Solirubrobacteraceae bacterium]